jgi:hypothetical protein
MDNKRKALGPPAADVLEGEEPEKKRQRLDADEYEELITRFSTREAWVPYSKCPGTAAFTVATILSPEERLEDGKNYLPLDGTGLLQIPEELWRCKLVDGFSITGAKMMACIPPGDISNWHGSVLSQTERFEEHWGVFGRRYMHDTRSSTLFYIQDFPDVSPAVDGRVWVTRTIEFANNLHNAKFDVFSDPESITSSEVNVFEVYVIGTQHTKSALKA